eukprot:682688-Amphidinium_carterae.1
MLKKHCSNTKIWAEIHLHGAQTGLKLRHQPGSEHHQMESHAALPWHQPSQQQTGHKCEQWTNSGRTDDASKATGHQEKATRQ